MCRFLCLKLGFILFGARKAALKILVKLTLNHFPFVNSCYHHIKSSVPKKTTSVQNSYFFWNIAEKKKAKSLGTEIKVSQLYALTFSPEFLIHTFQLHNFVCSHFYSLPQSHAVFLKFEKNCDCIECLTLKWSRY